MVTWAKFTRRLIMETVILVDSAKQVMEGLREQRPADHLPQILKPQMVNANPGLCLEEAAISGPGHG